MARAGIDPASCVQSAPLVGATEQKGSVRFRSELLQDDGIAHLFRMEQDPVPHFILFRIFYKDRSSYADAAVRISPFHPMKALAAMKEPSEKGKA